jgi:hypothetical protein
MLNYTYKIDSIQKNSKFLIENLTEEISDYFSNVELLSLSLLTKTNFEEINNDFKTIGFKYLNSIQNIRKEKFTNNELDLILDSFSELVLNNKNFSNSELFPNAGIPLMENKLQVWMLMNGKYFLLIPNSMKKTLDLQFYFK